MCAADMNMDDQCELNEHNILYVKKGPKRFEFKGRFVSTFMNIITKDGQCNKQLLDNKSELFWLKKPTRTQR